MINWTNKNHKWLFNKIHSIVRGTISSKSRYLNRENQKCGFYGICVNLVQYVLVHEFHLICLQPRCFEMWYSVIKKYFKIFFVIYLIYWFRRELPWFNWLVDSFIFSSSLAIALEEFGFQFIQSIFSTLWHLQYIYNMANYLRNSYIIFWTTTGP